MRHVAIVAKTDKVRRIEHNKPKCCIFERYTSKVTDYIRMHLQTPAIAEYMLFVPNIHEHSLRVPLVEPIIRGPQQASKISLSVFIIHTQIYSSVSRSSRMLSAMAQRYRSVVLKSFIG